MILDYLVAIDSAVFLDINHGFVNPVFDAVFPSLRVLMYVFWFLMIIYFWRRNEVNMALFLAVSIVAGALITYPLKFLINRARPYEIIDSTRLLTPPEMDPSFPSGHAEMSFLATTVISKIHPEYAKYLYPFSIIVAFSRVYVGVHFPGDVVGGAIVGIIIGRIMIWVAEKKKYDLNNNHKDNLQINE